MDLSVVVLTHNAKDVTLKMLPSLKVALDNLQSVAGSTWEVVVVDNDSTDGVAAEIERAHSGWLKLIHNENVGFSKGNNRGVHEVSKDSRYVLFLNPDILLEPDTILTMCKYMEDNKDVGLATCRVDLWNGGLDWDCHRAFPTPWRAFCYFTGLEKLLGPVFPRIFGGYHIMSADMTKTHEIDVCLGAFMIIPRTVGEEIHWWPEDYYLNGEDVDFCYKVKALAGYKVMYVPAAKIIHYKGASKGTKAASQKISTASKSTKVKQINSGADAMKIFYKKYYDQKYPKLLTLFIFAGIWLLRVKRLVMKKE